MELVQWFDDVFVANKQPNTIPNRSSTTIKDVEYYAEMQSKLEAEPQSYSEVIRQQQ